MKWVLTLITAVMLVFASPSLTFANEIDESSSVLETGNTPQSEFTSNGQISEVIEEEIGLEKSQEPIQVTSDSSDIESSEVNGSDAIALEESEKPMESAEENIVTTADSVSSQGVSNEATELTSDIELISDDVLVHEASSEIPNELNDTVKIKERSPLLQVNLLGLEVSLLGSNSLIGISSSYGKDSENRSVGLLSLGVSDKVEIGLLSGKKSSENGISKGGLLNVGIHDSKLLGDVNVGLLSETKSNNERKGGLLNVEVQNSSLLKPITGDVNVNLLASEKHSDNQTSRQGGLLSLELSDSALLGDISAGVISSKRKIEEDESNLSRGVLQLNLNNSLGLINSHVGLLENNQTVKGDTKTTNSGLLNVGLESDITGELQLNVGNVSTIQTPDFKQIQSGLVDVQVNNALLGNNEIGVANQIKTVTKDGTTTSGGLINIKSDSPLANIDINIGEFQNGNPIAEENANDPISSNDSEFDENGPTDAKDSNSSEDNKENTPGEGSTSSGNITLPVDVPDGQSDFPSDSIIIPDANDVEDNFDFSNEELDQNNEKIEKNEEEFSIMDMLNQLLDTGKKMVVNNGITKPVRNDSNSKSEVEEKIKKTIENLQTKDEITPNPNNINNINQSSSSSNTSVSDGHSQIFGYLASEILKETIENAKIKSQQFKLSNQWLRPPLLKPPILDSFLIENKK